MVFGLVNLALFVIKRRDPVPADVRPISLAVPVIDLLGSAFILLVSV
jgi:hypothetical protein